MSSEKEGKPKKNEYQEFILEVPLISKPQITEAAVEPKGVKNPNSAVKRSVAAIGDRFMRGQFFPAEELAKSADLWEGILHDINHMGTTFVTGFFAQSNILYFVGWQDNVQYDHESKSLSMDIHPKLNTHFGKDWQAFVELCEEAGRIPNVSISFLGKVKSVRAGSLPKGSHYRANGFKADDMIDYIYDIIPRALSTVLTGLCSDKQGCGIATNNSACDGKSCKKPPEITPKENKENKESAEKRAYLEKRLKKFGGK